MPPKLAVITKRTIPFSEGMKGSALLSWLYLRLDGVGTQAAPEEVNISRQQLLVIIDIAGEHVHFLVNDGAAYFVLASHAGSLSTKTCMIMGVDGKPLKDLLHA